MILWVDKDMMKVCRALASTQAGNVFLGCLQEMPAPCPKGHLAAYPREQIVFLIPPGQMFVASPGYVDIGIIPAGAREIRIEEVAEAGNFLALRSEDPEKYFLNGGWTIQWNGDYRVAGTTFTYARTGNWETSRLRGPPWSPCGSRYGLGSACSQGVRLGSTRGQSSAAFLCGAAGKGSVTALRGHPREGAVSPPQCVFPGGDATSSQTHAAGPGSAFLSSGWVWCALLPAEPHPACSIPQNIYTGERV